MPVTIGGRSAEVGVKRVLIDSSLILDVSSIASVHVRSVGGLVGGGRVRRRRPAVRAPARVPSHRAVLDAAAAGTAAAATPVTAPRGRWKVARLAALFLLPAFLGAQPAPAQAETIAPGENLVVEGVPPIPASLAEEVGRYTDFRTASFQGWHPERREMLVLTRFADTNQVHWVRAPGGARRQMTFFPDRVRGASFPRRSGDYFLLEKDVGGSEFSQLYRFDAGSGAITLVTDGTSQNALGPWSHGGDRMAYGSTRRNGRDRDLYVMDPLGPEAERRLVEVEGGGWFPADWSPDDTTILLVEFVSVNESYLWLVDAATGEKTLLTPKTGEKVAYGDPAFAADGKAVWAATDRDFEFRRLARIELATGAHTYLTSHIPWDVEELEVAPDGETVAFVTNEEGVSVLRLLDVATGTERRVAGVPIGVIGGLAWHPGGRHLAFSLGQARAPYDAYSLDAATGEVARWTESEIGGLDPATLPEPEVVRWPSFDGRTLSGLLYRPPARFAGKWPVIVNLHGGPEGQARPTFLGRWNYFASELGVALLYPNVRGSEGFGKSFLQLDNGRLREDSVRDIGALFDWIAEQPDLDADRVMVTGGSYGGYMTLATVVHYGERIRCAVDVVGISNFVTFLENTEAYRQDLRRAEYGDERDPAMREFLLSISPLSHAARIRTPLLIVQGQNDPRVPVTESEQMVAALRASGTPVWYLMARDEGHGFAKKSNADFQFYATVLFAREHLLGEPRPPAIPERARG